MVAFIDAHCQQQRDPVSRSARAKRDTLLCQEITRIWQENHGLYGDRKLWHALRREGWDVARCTVERLMRALGLQGVVRGKKVITTLPDMMQPIGYITPNEMKESYYETLNQSAMNVA